MEQGFTDKEAQNLADALTYARNGERMSLHTKSNDRKFQVNQINNEKLYRNHKRCKKLQERLEAKKIKESQQDN